jgi:hypothetical protein
LVKPAPYLGDATCGSDLVNDTPVQNTANYGCPCQKTSCTNAPFGEMYMNYMDYVDDICMQMFTVGQAARMNATLNGTRSALKTSLGLTPPSLYADDAGISDVINPSLSPCVNTNNTFIPEVVLNNFGSNALTSCTINYKLDNGTVQTQAWSGNLASGTSTSVTLVRLLQPQAINIYTAILPILMVLLPMEILPITACRAD